MELRLITIIRNARGVLNIKHVIMITMMTTQEIIKKMRVEPNNLKQTA